MLRLEDRRKWKQVTLYSTRLVESSGCAYSDDHWTEYSDLRLDYWTDVGLDFKWTDYSDTYEARSLDRIQ